MAQAESRSTTRRALIGALVVASFAAPSAAASLSQSDDNDAQFKSWWSDMDALEASINEAPLFTDEDQEHIDNLCDRAGELQDLILQTSGSSRTAAEIKLRTLIRYFGNTDATVVAPAQDILAYIEQLA